MNTPINEEPLDRATTDSPGTPAPNFPILGGVLIGAADGILCFCDTFGQMCTPFASFVLFLEISFFLLLVPLLIALAIGGLAGAGISRIITPKYHLAFALSPVVLVVIAVASSFRPIPQGCVLVI